MGKIAAVVSGKGGTGKTTLTAGIASCLAALGQRVLCIDADVGLRNLDISLGMSEYCAERIFDEGAELSQNVEEIDKKYRNAISDINVAQAALNNAMIDNEE